MASNYPTSLDNFTNPTVSDYLNSTTVPHATQHSDLNDAVENLQAKVGIDSSADTGSIDYKVTDAASRITTLEAGATANAVVAYADLSARTAANPSPSEGDVSWQEDTNRFDIYNGSAWVEVGRGKILQVIQTVKASSFSTTSAALVDITGLSVSITPTSATSKVLVQVNCALNRTDTNFSRLTVFRGDAATGTNLAAPSAGFGLFKADTTPYGWATINYLDSPSTTSATTYQAALAAAIGGGTASLQGEMSTITVMEVSA